MRREVQRFILEINELEGSEISVSVRGADGQPLSACYAIVLVDGQGSVHH